MLGFQNSKSKKPGFKIKIKTKAESIRSLRRSLLRTKQPNLRLPAPITVEWSKQHIKCAVLFIPVGTSSLLVSSKECSYFHPSYKARDETDVMNCFAFILLC